MSLRAALKAAVARCTPQAMQHATIEGKHATGRATAVQPMPANPHEIGVCSATAYATDMQLGAATSATPDQKLHVAFASTCNVQPGALTAHRITADLLRAAMRVCDHYGDSEAAREEMRQECRALPLHLQADLLDHFTSTAAKQDQAGATP